MKYLLLPQIPTGCIIAFSIGVALGVTLPAIAIVLGGFEGWWLSVAGLILFAFGLTPQLMGWVEDVLRKQHDVP
jgi:hypothetical protein